MTMMKVALMAAAAFCLVPAVSNAATVLYDEGVSGDLPNAPNSAYPNNPPEYYDLGIVNAGVWSVLGSLDGGDTQQFPQGPDEMDAFSFTATTDFTIKLLGLSGVDTLLILRLKDAIGVVGAQFASQPDVFGVLGAATYTGYFLPNANRGVSSYEMIISTPPLPGCEESNYRPPKCEPWRPDGLTPVPLPAALPLLLAGIGGLGFMARRKKKAA